MLHKTEMIFYGSAVAVACSVAIILPLTLGITFGERCNDSYPNISDIEFNRCVNHLVSGGDIQHFSMEEINNDYK